MFVQRDQAGLIMGVFRQPQPGYAVEELPDTHPDVEAFVNQPPSANALREQSINATIAADTTLSALKGMTNAEFDAWWAATVTTAAQASAVLKRLARLVLRRVL